MLMELSAKAQALDTDTIEFASIPQLLGLMGVSENSHYCERTREALTYWSRVEVRYLKWYLGRGRYRLNKMITPIEVIKYDGTRIKITLAPEYARPAKRYFKRIHLPLPSNETAQNITLCMLAWKWTASNGRDRMRTGPRLRLFMRKVGLGSHKNNASRYDAVVQRVVKPWFEKVYGWGFKHLIVEDRKVFVWLNRSRVEREAHHDADDAKMKREG
ncbi:hypothetical protein [Pseudorhodoplanes sp.]|uniref:hypothetical protein n=1 Tax=Pseudorhodoplanes sp. TaxID=1934341 RepID=UPI003D09D508